MPLSLVLILYVAVWQNVLARLVGLLPLGRIVERLSGSYSKYGSMLLFCGIVLR